MAATLCCRCGLRPAAAACSIVWFQSVTTSARACAAKPIGSNTAMTVILITRRRAYDLGFRFIFRLPLFKSGVHGSVGANDVAGEGSAQCTAAQLHINCG